MTSSPAAPLAAPAAASLATLLEDAASDVPSADAVVGLDEQLSWSGLQQAAAAVSDHLRDAGVVARDRVAIACLKDLQSYVAVHAILRAGAVVVPLDPLAPRAALHDVLADADVRAVLGDARTLDVLEPWAVEGLDLRVVVRRGGEDGRASDWDRIVAAGSSSAPASVLPDDPAYIIYTSGSTGRPKGIVHTHGSALAYAERAVATYGLTADDRIAGIPPLHFDQSTFELYAAPLARATVVAISEAQVRFPATLTQRSADERITIWYSVPSLFRQVVDRGGLDRCDLSSLRHILYGGEPYPGGALADLHAALPHVSVTNVYGPAEVNECTNHRVEFPIGEADETPIGRPWPGVEVGLLDDDAVMVPDEVVATGELVVAGPTMMREYWQRPDLTDRSIIERRGRRWYRTGDVVHRDEDGVLWFRGRRDNQIKLRGVRLELEAVESVVADAPGVAEAVVGPDATRTHLEAVVIPRPDVDLDISSARQFCTARLAAVAVPRRWHVRDHLPRTPSGKIDRSAVRHQIEERKPDETTRTTDENTVRARPQEATS